MIQITQKIPTAQKAILIEALVQLDVKLKHDLKGYEAEGGREDMVALINHQIFDIIGLKGLLGYEVSVGLSEKQYNRFTSVNNVDYPEFTKE